MSNETNLVEHPTADFILLRHGDDFTNDIPDDATLDIGIPTDRITTAELDLTNLAASGGARQSTIFNFGANRAPFYQVHMCAEGATQWADGETIAVYLGCCRNSSGNGLPGKLTGTDGAYTESDGLLAQLQSCGSLTVDNEDTVADFIAQGDTGIVTPKYQYGAVVVENETADNFHATTMDNTYILMTPMTWGN